MFEFTQLAGPLGGILAAAFGAGCVAGWGFAMKLMKGRIDDLKDDMEKAERKCAADVDELKAQVRKLNDFMLHGMERQLAQVRESGFYILPPSTGL